MLIMGERMLVLLPLIFSYLLIVDARTAPSDCKFSICAVFSIFLIIQNGIIGMHIVPLKVHRLQNSAFNILKSEILNLFLVANKIWILGEHQILERGLQYSLLSSLAVFVLRLVIIIFR